MRESCTANSQMGGTVPQSWNRVWTSQGPHPVAVFDYTETVLIKRVHNYDHSLIVQSHAFQKMVGARIDGETPCSLSVCAVTDGNWKMVTP